MAFDPSTAVEFDPLTAVEVEPVTFDPDTAVEFSSKPGGELAAFDPGTAAEFDPESAMPVEVPQLSLTGKATNLAKNFAKGLLTQNMDAVGGALRAIGVKEAGEGISRFAKEIDEDYLKTVGEPTFADELAQGFGSAASFFVPGLGVTKAAKALTFAPRLAKILGTSYAATSEALVEGGATYNEVVQRGGTHEEAQKAAGKTFALNIPTNYILDRWVFNKLPEGKKLSSIIRNAPKEGAQEMIQNVISTWAKNDPVFTQENVEQMLHEGLLGTLVGGGIHATKVAAEALTETPAEPGATETPPSVSPQIPTAVSGEEVRAPGFVPPQAPTPEGARAMATAENIAEDVASTQRAEIATEAQIAAGEIPSGEEPRRPAKSMRAWGIHKEFMDWAPAQGNVTKENFRSFWYNKTGEQISREDATQKMKEASLFPAKPEERGPAISENLMADEVALTDIGAKMERYRMDMQKEMDENVPKAEEKRAAPRRSLEDAIEDAIQENVARGVKITPEIEAGIIAGVESGSVNPVSSLPGKLHRESFMNKHRIAPKGKTNMVVQADLDYFKRINDTHGETAGDSFLRDVMVRVHNAAQQIGFPGLEHDHVSGDEHVFLAQIDEKNVKNAVQKMQRLKRELNDIEVQLPDGQWVPVGQTMGISFDPNISIAFKQADETLKLQKKTAKNTLGIDIRTQKKYNIKEGKPGEDIGAAWEEAGLLPTSREKLEETENGTATKSAVPPAVQVPGRGGRVRGGSGQGNIAGTPGVGGVVEPGNQETRGSPTVPGANDVSGEEAGPPGSGMGEEQGPVAPETPEPPGGEPPTPVTPEPKTWMPTPEGRVEWFIRRAQDTLRRLKTTQEAITKQTGKVISEEADAYMGADIIHSKIGVELTDFETTLLKPMLELAAKNKIDIEDIGLYRYAEHAAERNAHVKAIRPELENGSGMDNETANNILAAYQEEGKGPVMQELSGMVDKIVQYQRDLIKRFGLEDPREIDAWATRYKKYIPLKGPGENVDSPPPQFPRVGRGFKVMGKESKRALGRTTMAKTEEIMAQLVGQVEATIGRAYRNEEIGKRFLKLVRDNPNPKLWMIDVPETKPFFNKRTGEVQYGFDPRYKLQDNVFSVKEDGKEIHITIIEDPALAAGLMNLETTKAGKVFSAIAAFTRYKSMIHTSLDPEFMATNFARDIQTALINISSENSGKLAIKTAKNVPAAMKGAYQAIKGNREKGWAKWFDRYERAGGRVEFSEMMSIEQKTKRLNSAVKSLRPGVKSSTINVFRAAKDWIMDANSAVENATRLSFFRTLVENGVSEAKAAQAAKNLTVNFNKHGDWGPMFNGLYVFANAGVQGAARLIKVAKTPRFKKIAAGIAIGSFMLAEMNRYMAGDDDDGENFYDKIGTFEKTHNLILMRPDGSRIKVPLPYGYNMFYAVGTTLSDLVHGADKLTAIGGLIGTIGDAFNPFGSGSLLQRIAPTFLDWAAELGLNKNFMGQPLKPEQPPYGAKKPASELHFKNISKVSETISDALNEITGGNKYREGAISLNPTDLDYMIGYLTGGAGKLADRTIDLVSDVYADTDLPAHKIPFMRRFYGQNIPEMDVGKFYEHVQELKQIEYEQKGLSEDRVSEAVKQKTKEGKRFIMADVLKQKSGQAGSIEDRIKDLKRQINEAEDRGQQPLVKALEKQMLREMKMFNRLWNSIVKEK